ncbi:hypothetical protein SAY86_006893 [Trapa natans]|uniref:AMP-dependent synthetase/ligase domain-containing protein n=1 Tax=Trapa natans TaxID=22666 RepID=A0AAN7LD46_TRANT|nr:hypothetical protein SAY86_006893 [Trapa natans]
MTPVCLKSNLFVTSKDLGNGFHFIFPSNLFPVSFTVKTALRRHGPGRILRSLHRNLRVYCQSKTEEKQVRRYSPFLEGAVLSSKGAILASDEWRAIPDIWRSSAEKYGDKIALVDPYHNPPSNMTYKQLEQEILYFSEGLRVIGVKPDEKLALFADNSCRWLVSDQGIMATGAINVVRGSRSSVEELMQIYDHSESVALVVDNPELFNRISEVFCTKRSIRFVILLWGDKDFLNIEGSDDMPVFSYNEIIQLGKEGRNALLESHDDGRQFDYEVIKPDDIATLVYTSGTTGNPKGVMLTHRNLLHQIQNLWEVVPTIPGDRFLSMLPPWHAYERACEYFILTYGIEQVYTTVKNLKEDLQRYQPQYLISVPLVYETLYSGIQRQLSSGSMARKLIALTFIKISMAYMEFKRIYEGKCLTKDQKQQSYIVSLLDCVWARVLAAILLPLHTLANKIVYRKIRSAIGISKAGISGGGSLPVHVDKFFEAIGVTVQNGYGLTECSPVTAARRLDCNVLGTIGHPIKYTEFKIVDPETNETLSPGTRGIVKVRGPQVMKGYYKNSSATEKVLDSTGWFDTGDLGWITPQHSRGRSRHAGGIIVLEGRAKDTIVLSTGENVEPGELEEAATRSPLIQQIVVIGQDQRRLGAIIVPNKEEVLLTAKRSGVVDANASEINKDRMMGLLHDELKTWTTEFSFQIGPILLADEPFTIESGLMTPTMKIRRDKIVEKYQHEIAKLYV